MTDLFDRFSEPAKVLIFFAVYIANDDRASCITPEHILHALIHKDPQVFANVAPNIPELLDKLKAELCSESPAPFSQEKLKTLPLSEPAKDIIRMADKQRARLGQKHIDLQHLVLAILACKGPFTVWFTSRTRHSKAQELLQKHGLTAAAVKARIKEGGVEATSK
jgi:ATP-dependent Clp protease ATP-binding subunit ClpC